MPGTAHPPPTLPETGHANLPPAAGRRGQAGLRPHRRPFFEAEGPPIVASKIFQKVNGTQAWVIDTFKARKGMIGIEAEGPPVDFKNLRIKILKKE